MKEDKDKSSDKNQTYVLIGVALIILAVLFVFFAFMQPRVSNDYAVSNAETVLNLPSFSSSDLSDNQQSAAASQASAETEKSSASFPINLNTCSASDLMEIKGVGEKRANAIISYRDVIGGYTSVEQLKDISGIGESVYASIEPYVTV